ncbi:7-cyano-7-deazaguanine synthase QueC [Clostridium botulinum]|uniref:7-cyano-7-deazaguanine synthase n=2 Tax=Clostridium botulinum TaxID=1491 RepID=QUEC_CLOBM|nr:7-cyano-7-deazaguanine synthase QueC [Clostridium botulinum]B1L1S2.1 RecName: Full=7-cyano-7-deazaguanine synthase; AltName: Full=7-cyano-7-carbaguanine synthase; AltName: Full=PreQ(0) synthase; AltName: Full=Queuosine biosynthesis protein QueC [Clostridium botulinum A3 str. Loch Maree]ACA55565.1 exsB protein [Clostridium botulinum A3 str. Loch Maree]NFH65126.1 7-cyano-7-deazaguanine synthase QueC [Clostridium botulinum]NFJ10057.1 7-cyano-7-deazaguanine synthase QueC [Clostridium botulinum]
MNKEKAIVVFSGGQDSTTCLFWAKKKYEEVIAVSFDYNQKHKLELDCAKDICKKYNVEHHILDLNLLNQLAPNSLTRQDITVDKSAPKEGVPNSFVDGRNLLFLSFVAVFAKQKGVNTIITGVSQSDFSGYPDCRAVFIKSLNVTLDLAMDYEFEIITPLMWINKAETWKMAYDLGVLDIVKEETLTCYNGIKADGCGECPACKLRKKGYLEFEKQFMC